MCFSDLCDTSLPGVYIDPPKGARFVTAGGTGLLYAYPNNTREIMKLWSRNPDSSNNMQIEKRIYDRIQKAGGHPNIVKCIRIQENGIVLERARYGDLRGYFRRGGTATRRERMGWCKDLSSALAFVHSHNIKHCDLCCKNVLLDENRRIKLCDFAGSSISGSPPQIWPEPGFAHPREAYVRRAKMEAELHALGSTIYEIMTSRRPYHNEPRDGAVHVWFQNGNYPEVNNIGLGNVMLKCWKGEYKSADQVKRDIMREIDQEAENLVKLVDPQRDALYNYDQASTQALMESRPWAKDPHYFKSIRISAIALLKMVMHARSGGSLEIMGLMQGYVAPNTFVVTDAFRLPVEGTETRVNAQDEANEYMVSYLQSCRDSGRLENAIGWYHSHPGYGCWLSGIDVSTQDTQQTFSDPFVAVVIDPDRTISAGKVEIGAFRTYPKGYTPPRSEHDDDEYQSIPLNKVEDFGAHASQYYSLEVSHFKSSLDTKILSLLWNKYWVATISQSPLFTNRDYENKQMLDLSQKIKRASKAMSSRGSVMSRELHPGDDQQKEHADGRDQALTKVVKEGDRIVGEELTGLLASEIKQTLFQGVGQAPQAPKST
ncbi:COP9 signalosome catalytic subunit rri1 [Myotisia sp. PD_48]|nr:COP9 signalosome catalytic subunit rri1 [Myotisia sp. PD_48]